MCNFSFQPFDLSWVSALVLSMAAGLPLATAVRRNLSAPHRTRLCKVSVAGLALAAVPLVAATYTAVDWTVYGDPCVQMGWDTHSAEDQRRALFRMMLPAGSALAVFALILVATVALYLGPSFVLLGSPPLGPSPLLRESVDNRPRAGTRSTSPSFTVSRSVSESTFDEMPSNPALRSLNLSGPALSARVDFALRTRPRNGRSGSARPGVAGVTASAISAKPFARSVHPRAPFLGSVRKPKTSPTRSRSGSGVGRSHRPSRRSNGEIVGKALRIRGTGVMYEVRYRCEQGHSTKHGAAAPGDLPGSLRCYCGKRARKTGFRSRSWSGSRKTALPAEVTADGGGEYEESEAL